MFQMRFPDGYLWEYPGFPSLAVSYLKTNDFFYSGHVGFPTIFAFEHNEMGNTKLVIFCVFTLFMEMFTMIATHGHYIIDLLAGFVIGHYVTIIADRIARNYIDKWAYNTEPQPESQSEYKGIPQDDIEKPK